MGIIRKSTILAFALTLFMGGYAAGAEEEKPSASAGLGVFSKYVWRGFELSDDSMVVQPSLGVGYKGLTLGIWGNLDTDFDDRDPTLPDKSDWTETDLTLEYARSFGPVAMGFGYIYYALDGVDDSQELYVSAGLDLPLAPTLTVYREIAHLQGWYMNLGLSHSFDLPRDMTLDLSGSVGYYYSSDDAFVEVDSQLNPTTKKYRGLHDGLVSAGLTVPLGKYLTLNPLVAYSFPLSGGADDLIASSSYSGDSGYLYGGATLSIFF